MSTGAAKSKWESSSWTPHDPHASLLLVEQAVCRLQWQFRMKDHEVVLHFVLHPFYIDGYQASRLEKHQSVFNHLPGSLNESYPNQP